MALLNAFSGCVKIHVSDLTLAIPGVPPAQALDVCPGEPLRLLALVVAIPPSHRVPTAPHAHALAFPFSLYFDVNAPPSPINLRGLGVRVRGQRNRIEMGRSRTGILAVG